MLFRHRREHAHRTFRTRRAHRFLARGQRGSTTIEAAIGITLLVVSLGGLMESVGTVFDSDRMSRAARAAARSLALNPAADACAAIRTELRLPADFVCTSKWTLDIDRDLAPSDLTATSTDLTTLDPNSALAGSGDMVLVRIGTLGDSPDLISMALARSEP